MSNLRIYLFGHPEVFMGDHAVARNFHQKDMALLAFLVTTGRAHSREKLAALLWGAYPDKRARTYLRKSLGKLRNVLGDYVLLSGTTVSINNTLPIQADVVTFEQALKDWPSSSPITSEEAEIILEGIAHYRGSFLEGSRVRQAIAFEEWRLRQQTKYLQLALGGLHRLADFYFRQGALDKAAGELNRLLELEPWQESAHRQLMEVLHLQGQRGAAIAQYQYCRQILKEALGVEPGLKTKRLYQHIVRDQKSGFPPAAFQERHNLPNSLTSFFGRETELANIIEALPLSRAITLTGIGGVGKTRLALEVANRVKTQFLDGVWFVELADSNQGGSIAQTTASVLNVMLGDGVSALETILRYLKSKQLLLILDNCEHLVRPVSDFVHQVLLSCPDVKVLATSREYLNVQGEVVWQVAPFELSFAVRETSGEQLRLHPSVRLFEARAKAVCPEFILTPPSLALVAGICQRLEGLPLAIELAAGRMQVLSLQQIADRLHQRFALLKRGGYSQMSRLEAIRSSIAWSYDLLDPIEQKLLNRLTIFAGDMIMVAIEGVCSGNGIFESDVLDIMAQLINKSLVSVKHRESEVQYHLLESVRDYANEQLELSGEKPKLEMSHFAYYLKLAEDAEPRLFASDQIAWMAMLSREHNNFRQALRWAFNNNETEKGLRLAAALWYFWYIRGHHEEGLHWLMVMLKLKDSQQFRWARAKALTASGYMSWIRNDISAASELLEEGLHLAEQAGHLKLFTAALRGLALVRISQGDLSQGTELLKQSVGVAQKINDRLQESAGLFYLGDLATLVANFPMAREQYEASIRLLHAIDNQIWLAYPLRRLAWVELQEENLVKAEKLCLQSQEINEMAGDMRGKAASLIYLATIKLAQKHHGKVKQLLHEIEKLFDMYSFGLQKPDEIIYQLLQESLSGSPPQNDG